MGFEVEFYYHNRLEDAGYDTENLEKKSVKIGKPFDDVPLEKLAAAITSQLARRDIWVVDVKVYELVKQAISFKESKDGKGIVLKNRKFSLSGTSEMTFDGFENEQPAMLAGPTKHPHEMLQRPTNGTALAPVPENPNLNLAVNPNDPRSVNKGRVLYHVYYEPYFHEAEAKTLRLKFTEEKKYPVHAVIPSKTGKLDAQKLAVSDDTGQVVILDEKFFSAAGQGLLGDKELNFSERGKPRSKLLYEEPALSAEMLEVPDIRRR